MDNVLMWTHSDNGFRESWYGCLFHTMLFKSTNILYNIIRSKICSTFQIKWIDKTKEKNDFNGLSVVNIVSKTSYFYWFCLSSYPVVWPLSIGYNSFFESPSLMTWIKTEVYTPISHNFMITYLILNSPPFCCQNNPDPLRYGWN